MKKTYDAMKLILDLIGRTLLVECSWWFKKNFACGWVTVRIHEAHVFSASLKQHR